MHYTIFSLKMLLFSPKKCKKRILRFLHYYIRDARGGEGTKNFFPFFEKKGLTNHFDFDTIINCIKIA